MDVLLDEDVAGERAIPEPVAQAVLGGGRAGAHLFDRGRRVIEGGDGGDLAQGAGLHTTHGFGDGRSVAHLEANVDALRRTDLAGDGEGAAGLRDVDPHRLLAVDVLAGADSRLQFFFFL